MPTTKTALKIYVTDDEHKAVTAKARQCSLSVSEFGRRVCLGLPIQSQAERQEFLDLLQINADLGRLGGLLKLWLTDPAKRRGMAGSARSLLHEIEGRQRELKLLIDSKREKI